MVQRMKDNKYDALIFIEGKRGIGKSTLGAKIMYRLGFSPKRDIVYSRDEVIRAFAKRKFGYIYADEMVNVGYRRDFWDSDQKTLIKIMNMYRDSCNVFVGCVPFFSQLDKHFQSLVKIRLTVISRGLAIVQRQLSSIYTEDPWDMKKNQKIESKWITGKAKPQYHKLTTFVGLLRFGDLTPNQREEIDAIKEEKRNRVVRIEEGEIPEEDDSNNLLKRVYEGTMTIQLLRDYCQLTNKKYVNIRALLNRKIADDPKAMGKTLKDFTTIAEEKINMGKVKKKFNI